MFLFFLMSHGTSFVGRLSFPWPLSVVPGAAWGLANGVKGVEETK